MLNELELKCWPKTFNCRTYPISVIALKLCKFYNWRPSVVTICYDSWLTHLIVYCVRYICIFRRFEAFCCGHCECIDLHVEWQWPIQIHSIPRTFERWIYAVDLPVVMFSIAIGWNPGVAQMYEKKGNSIRLVNSINPTIPVNTNERQIQCKSLPAGLSLSATNNWQSCEY